MGVASGWIDGRPCDKSTALNDEIWDGAVNEAGRAMMRRRIDFEIAALVEVFQKIRHRDWLLRGEKLDVEISLYRREPHRVRVRIVKGISQIDLRRYAGEDVSGSRFAF